MPFEKLQSRQVYFVSIWDAIDLSTAARRLIANVVASKPREPPANAGADRRRVGV